MPYTIPVPYSLSLSLSSFLPPCSTHTTRPINIKSYYLSWKTEIVGLIIVVSSMFCNLATARPSFFYYFFFFFPFWSLHSFPSFFLALQNIDRSLLSFFPSLSRGKLLSLSGLTLPIFSFHLLSSLPLSRAISLTLRKTSKTRLVNWLSFFLDTHFWNRLFAIRLPVRMSLRARLEFRINWVWVFSVNTRYMKNCNIVQISKSNSRM